MPLGEVSDGEIARHLGCLTSQVRQARSRRGIGPFMAPSRGPKHIDWDNYPLGQKPDTDIAAEAGVSPKAVRDARRKRNISVYRRMSHKWDEHPLDKVSDYALAQKLGVTRSTVKKARKLRGIPACPIGDNKCNGTDWDAQPLGEQSDTTALKLRRWVQRYPCAPGRLTLDHVGYFHRPGIVWIGPSSPPDSLLKLQSDLSRQLTRWGLPHQPQQFRPHVSLLRSAMTQSAQPLSEDYFCWPYTSIQLIQSSISHEGSRYTTLATSR